jgi:hypothetical protein
MASEQPRDAFEAALRAKIAAWQAALDHYLAAVALDGALPDAGGSAPQQARENGRSMDLPVGIFRDKSIREAIEIYLGAGRRKQTNKEIAVGLQRGGIATTSVNFEATVATALGRMREDGTVLRFPDGWDLASSYPESLRSRLDKDSKPAKTRGKEKAKPKPKKPAGDGKKEKPSADKTMAILKIVGLHHDGINLRDILTVLTQQGLSASRDYVRVVTKRLRKRGLIESRDGKFFPSMKPF